jgi:Mce-associated membrane protein
MPSRERVPEALEAGGCDGSSPERAEATSSQPSLADAQEAVALAEARAQAARERATQLNQKADAIAGNQDKTTDAAADGEDIEDAAVADSITEPESPSATARRRRFRLRRWLRRPRRKTVAAGVAAALVCCSLAASSYLMWHHWTVAYERQRSAEFAAAARQEAITLLSIDASKAREDVQRIIDNTTGQFKAGMLLHAEELATSVKQSKVSTKVTIQAIAVESMTDDSAVVLVAVKAEAVNPGKDKPPPRSWRMIMTLHREAGRPKISAIEVLP